MPSKNLGRRNWRALEDVERLVNTAPNTGGATSDVLDTAALSCIVSSPLTAVEGRGGEGETCLELRFQAFLARSTFSE